MRGKERGRMEGRGKGGGGREERREGREGRDEREGKRRNGRERGREERREGREGRDEREGKRRCAADFSLLNLPKGKSLGRSKPATSSYAQAPQHTVWETSTISKPY